MVIQQHGIGRRSALAGGGGTDDAAGGGYTGGSSEAYKTVNSNGLGGYGTILYGASGYYGVGEVDDVTADKYRQILDNMNNIGGQGVDSYSATKVLSKPYSGTYGGDGGVAGAGGTINVSSNATIYAYNGNRITNGDYTTTYYEYEVDGTETVTVASVLIKNDTSSTNFIQTTIYAQSGILRDVYKLMNMWELQERRTYAYLYYFLQNTFLVNEEYEATRESVLVREQTTCSTTGYTNPATGSTQGIGSGAGYIELSNGTYTVDSSMN